MVGTWDLEITQSPRIIFFISDYSTSQIFPNLGYADHSSVLIQFYGWCCAETKEKKSIFRFLSFELWKFIDNWGDDVTKIIINRKLIIWNLVFLSIQPIPDLSCISENFWKKKLWSKILEYFWEIFFTFCISGVLAPHEKASRVWEFFLGFVDPSRNRLVSTSYQKKPGFTLLHA